MARESFQAELLALREAVCGLGDRVRRAVDDSTRALAAADLQRSHDLVERAVDVSRIRWAIEERAIVAVAQQAPVASDLRRLMSYLATLNDLARIGDHARGIGEIGVLMGPATAPRSLGYLPSMADRALAMLDDCLVALAQDDLTRARHVLGADDDLDRLQARVYADAFQSMISDRSRIQEQTYVLWAAHNIERVGDRATNVSESVIFLLTGHREFADAPPFTGS